MLVYRQPPVYYINTVDHLGAPALLDPHILSLAARH